MFAVWGVLCDFSSCGLGVGGVRVQGLRGLGNRLRA